MDDFCYESLKSCYGIISEVSTTSFVLLIISIFLATWVVVLIIKLMRERRANNEDKDKLLSKILELSKKGDSNGTNGIKKIVGKGNKKT